VNTLETILEETTRYARFTMKKNGCRIPVMMAATPGDVILFSPDQMTDTGAKDDFANEVRLITGSHWAHWQCLSVAYAALMTNCVYWGS
jgi:hypothetical protein